jgi:hypothetical protein
MPQTGPIMSEESSHVPPYFHLITQLLQSATTLSETGKLRTRGVAGGASLDTFD